MASGTVNGFSVGYSVAGVIILWSGLSGKSITQTFQSIVKGSVPAANPDTTPAVNTTVPASNAGNPTGNQVLGQQIAAAYGWGSGTQWNDLVALFNRESNWDNNATNPASGAYGIAQALGHGQGVSTQGTVTNEYGGYGISDAEAQAANSGDAGSQITWGLQYIKATYGSPSVAWGHEQLLGWY